MSRPQGIAGSFNRRLRGSRKRIPAKTREKGKELSRKNAVSNLKELSRLRVDKDPISQLFGEVKASRDLMFVFRLDFESDTFWANLNMEKNQAKLQTRDVFSNS